jgi:hypothetical protein
VGGCVLPMRNKYFCLENDQGYWIFSIPLFSFNYDEDLADVDDLEPELQVVFRQDPNLRLRFSTPAL